MTTAIITEITEIALADLHESPFNPRQHYDPTALAELAADIKSHGRILQPLLVRPRVGPLFAGSDDPAAVAGYELVFGHRRLRAAVLAGLIHAPCMVHAMTDAEVKRAQISENLQRADVHPFEEAEGFAALIRDHGETADTLAVQLGGPSKRSYVYGRLKLLAACKQVREACIAGKIGSEVALLIARLRTDKLQAKALARIEAKYYDLGDGGTKSLRNIRELLKDEFTLDLKQALWDVTSETVTAGTGACTTCYKRSANAPEFVDLIESRDGHFKGHKLGGNPNLCTDPDCWASKKTAHLKTEADKLRNNPNGRREVIDGNRARALVSATGEVKNGYLPLASVKAELQQAVAAAQRNARIPMPAPVFIQDPRTGKIFEAVKESELIAAGVRKAGTAPKPKTSGGHSSRDHEAKRMADQAQAKARTDMHTLWLRRVREAARTELRSTFDLRLIATVMFEEWRHSDDEDALLAMRAVNDGDELQAQIDSLDPAELALLLLDFAWVRGVEVPYWDLDKKPAHLLAAAAHYGVSLAPESEPTSTPSPAALAPAGLAPEVATATATPAPTPTPAARAPAEKPAVPYRNAATGETWSGRGKHPKWLEVAIATGAKLADFKVSQAGSAGNASPSAAVAAQSSSTTPTKAGGDSATGGLFDAAEGQA